MKITKRVLSTLMSGVLAGAMCLPAIAAGYPDKPITAIVPFPAGGSTDMIARVIGPRVNQRLGQPIIVENRAGATGAIGAGLVKRAPADGYTIMVASIAVYAVNPFLQKKLPYDPVKDFDLLTVAVRAPNVLIVNPSLPINSIPELIAYLKKNPGKMTFGSSGAGSSDHLNTELFWQKTATSGVHIPYKGGAPVITDVIGGHLDVSFQNINVVLPHLKTGKLRALAITSASRSALIPDGPTLSESGVKEVDVYSWQGIAAPKGLPADVKAKLHGAIVSSLNEPDVKNKLTEQGFEVVANTPEAFNSFLQTELVRWKKVVEVGNITIE
jgi:tripartite-type tricarboxylate transporter receptor subunit TctC